MVISEKVKSWYTLAPGHTPVLSKLNQYYWAFALKKAILVGFIIRSEFNFDTIFP